MSGCGDQSSGVGTKMQDIWRGPKVEEARSADNKKLLQSEPPTRESFADERCVRSEEEMKEIFASVRPELPVLPSRIERPETLGKVCLPTFLSCECAAWFSLSICISRREGATATF